MGPMADYIGIGCFSRCALFIRSQQKKIVWERTNVQ